MPPRSKRNRCKECPGCLATDCGECRACMDLPKFGGPGRSHSCCVQRLCHALYREVGKEGKRIRDYPRKQQPHPDPASPQQQQAPLSAVSVRSGDTTSTTASPAPSTAAVPAPPPSSAPNPLPLLFAVAPQQLQSQSPVANKLPPPPPIMDSEGPSTPLRPKRKRVEPKRIQDSVDRPQWGHGHHKQQQQQQQQKTPKHGEPDINNNNNAVDAITSRNHKRPSQHNNDPEVAVRVRAPRLSSMKHGTTDLDTVKKSSLGQSEATLVQLPTPTLADYVDQRIIAAFQQQQQQATTKPFPVAAAAAADHEEKQMYGYKVPDAPPENTCAGCLGRRDAELEDNPIVLCDGEGCGREYHLNCCNPSLSDEKEQERWLCEDCCPNGGSTAFLIRYLEESDDRKAEFLVQSTATDPHAAFIDHLLRQDTKSENKRLDRFPISQLERGALTDATARADTVSRTRRSQEHTLPLTPDFYVGKPVRIFSLVGSQYHTGRIADFRMVAKTSSAPQSINDFEFLIRFPAGVEGRKTAYRHWIVLEEHGTCVGTTLVWAHMPGGDWQPSIVWLRTARELIPIQHHLIESEGQIQYRPAHHYSAQDDVDDEALLMKKSKFKVLALVRPFGHVNVFHTLNAKDKMMDLFNETAVKEFLKDGKKMLQFEMAKTEYDEQMKVRRWRELKLEDPMGYYALSSVDAYSLPLLQPSSYGQISLESHAELCPTVRRGLDRNKLVAQLQRRGGKVSKDLGAAITCKLIEFHPRMLWEGKSSSNGNDGNNSRNGHGPTIGKGVAIATGARRC